MRKIDYNNYQKPSRFVKLSQGDTKLKIVSDGVIGYEHGMNAAGRYVPLGPCSENLDCEQCAKGNEPSLKFKWIAYLPELKEVRVLSVGSKLGDSICGIAKEEEKAGHKSFEIIINRVGLGRNDTRFTVRKPLQPSQIDGETAAFIKQSRDYLYRKYMQ